LVNQFQVNADVTLTSFRPPVVGQFLGNGIRLLKPVPLPQPAPLLTVCQRLPTNDEKIDRSIAYMKAPLSERITAQKLAAVAHISCSHFFVLFKRPTRKAPIDYLINLRMQEAARLLETTKMDVKAIALAVGYEDPFYFSRVFNTVRELPPSRCRERARQSNSSRIHT